MIKHIILLPLYAIIGFGAFFSCYMVFWFLPFDYYETYGGWGLAGYIAVVVFFVWTIVSLIYVSPEQNQ